MILKVNYFSDCNFISQAYVNAFNCLGYLSGNLYGSENLWPVVGLAGVLSNCYDHSWELTILPASNILYYVGMSVLGESCKEVLRTKPIKLRATCKNFRCNFKLGWLT